MATGGGKSLGKSIYLGSDETFEFACTRCEGKGKLTEAKNYCANCHEFYCSDCVEIHWEISALKTHKVLGKDSKQDWGQQKGIGPTGPGCEDHDGQTLSMYCGDHDTVCCPVCVSLEHKTCDQMAYIPKISSGIFQSQDLVVLTSNLRILRSQMEHMIQNGDDMKNNLDLSRQNCLKYLSDFREKIKNIFDKLEKKIITEIDEILKNNQDSIEKVQKACENVVTEVEKQEKLLADSNNITEQQMFFRIRDVKREVQVASAMAKNVPVSAAVDQFTFDVDQKLDSFVICLQSLGNIRTFRSPTKSPQAPVGSSCIYRSTTKEKFEIKVKKDKRDCCIESMCQLADGSIILADSMNSNIKRLNSAYTITDHLSLPSYPYSICSTGAQEAAVALHNNSIQFVSTQSGKMKALRSIQLGHQCCCIAYQNGKLYISEFLGKKIFVYSSISCSHLKTIEADQSGKKLFAKIKCMQVSDNGFRLFVSDLDKGILVLDQQCNLVSTLDFPDSDTICTMCLDPHGNLFVGSNESGKVMQIFNRNAYVVASKPNGVKNPASIMIDIIKSKLLVFQGTSGNTVMAFQLA